MAIAFTKVSLPYGWLGNMSPHPIWWFGKRWNTAEALFQASRFNDPLVREAIRAERSPMGAKMVAKKWADRMVVVPTSEQDVRNMEWVVSVKLEENRELVQQLLDTGDELIVEDVTARPAHGNHRFWGAALVNGAWVGENTLGKIWMRARERERRELYEKMECENE